MPGTIQVSVMDFQGPPSTSTPTFLKVSLGKKEYQISDKGDFSFPLTNIRDNLVVKLVDAEGNEAAHTGIQTMSIVEKVLWDEVFLFNGGGFVHLKLQFILSEEERTRIRLKREAAVKKHGNTQKVSEDSDIAPSTGGSLTSSRKNEREETGSLDNVTVQASLLRDTDYGPEGSTLKQRSTKSIDEREGAFSAPTVQRTEVHGLEANWNVKKPEIGSSLPNVHRYQVREDSSRLVYSRSYAPETSSVIVLGKDDDPVGKSEKHVPLERSPSSVRNLVTAFESSLAKDSKSSVKVPVVRSEPKKVGKQGHPKDYDPVDFSESAKQTSERHKDPSKEDLRSTLGTSAERGEGTDSAKSNVDNITNEAMKTGQKIIAAPIRSAEKKSNSRAWAELPARLESSSTTEKPTVLGKMDTELSEGGYSFRLSAEKQYSGGTLLAEGRGRTESAKIDIQVPSIEKSKSLECYEEELLYSENSGMWIFPNNMKHLCITAAGKRVMNLLGSDSPETQSHQQKSSLSSGEGRKDQQGPQSVNSSSSERAPDKGSGGLFGQVMKIAIIVGFGVLVFITRQREPRKSKREANELLLETSKFMDEQSATEE